MNETLRNLPQKIFPEDYVNVPTVAELQYVGLENLGSLSEWVETAETKMEGEELEFCQKYLANIRAAITNAESKPLITECRSISWAKPGETLFATRTTNSPATGGVAERVFVPVVLNRIVPPTCTDDNNASDEITLVCSVNSNDWEIDTVEYPLKSPCLIRAAERDYFAEHREYLEVWLEFCGVLDESYKLDDVAKQAVLKQYFS